MPYGKSYRDTLMRPFAAGQGIDADEWKQIMGRVEPAPVEPKAENPCIGCRKFKKDGCAFGETHGSDRCKEILAAPEFTLALRMGR